MRHGDAFRKLGRNTAGRRQLFQNQITSLIRHERIVTTLPKAKELRRVVEKIITKAKRDSPKVQEKVFSFLKKEETLNKLYHELARGRYKDRTGGYTRIWLSGYRKGDRAPLGIIELIDSPFDMRKAFTQFAREKEMQSNIMNNSSPKGIIINPAKKVTKGKEEEEEIEDRKSLSVKVQKSLHKKDKENKILANESYPINLNMLRKNRILHLEEQMKRLSVKDLIIKKGGLTPRIKNPYFEKLMSRLEITMRTSSPFIYTSQSKPDSTNLIK